jgi:hypothetical protein
VLAALDGVVLLSEANPASANLFAFGLNPAQQIDAHYPQLELPPYPGHIAELGAPALFGAFIRQLAEACAARDRHLVLRDYNYADYIGAPFTWQASGRSSLDAALAGAEIWDMLLIRHPVAQFASLKAHPELANVLTPEMFLAGYRLLLERHAMAWQMRYEDLYGAFDERLAEIAGYFQLPLDAGWPERLAEIDWITGHELGKSTTRPDPARPPDPELRERFRALEDYQLICRRAGYEA